MLKYILVYHIFLSVHSEVQFMFKRQKKLLWNYFYVLLKWVKKHSKVQLIAFNIYFKINFHLIAINMQLGTVLGKVTFKSSALQYCVTP